MRTVTEAGLIVGLFLMAISLGVPASRADAMNEATKMTFNQPVRVQGQVLPAGTYWFTVLDGNTGSLNVTRIYNANRSKVLTTLETESTDKTGGYGEEATVNGVHWPTGKLVLTLPRAASASLWHCSIGIIPATRPPTDLCTATAAKSSSVKKNMKRWR